MSIKEQNIIDSFAQDVVSDVYLAALDKEDRKITIPELDKICMDHPWYDEIEHFTLEEVVGQIEQYLIKEDLLKTNPTQMKLARGRYV